MSTTYMHSGVDTRARTISRTLARPRAAARLRRMGAFTIDSLVYLALTSLLSLVFNVLGGTLGSLLYASLHDCTLGAGRSLGRAAMGHRLLHTDGREVSFAVAIIRNAVRWLMWSTVLLFFVDLVLFFIGDGRILADFIMNTQVSEDPDRTGLGGGEERRSFSAQGARFTARVAQPEVLDPDVAEAQRELNFNDPGYARDELRRFDQKLTGEHETVGAGHGQGYGYSARRR